MKRSPSAAFWLSLLPGVGHLYLGQFAKGIVFPLILSGIFNAIDNGADGLGIVIPVYWLAVMLDARRSAQEINLAIDRGVLPAPGMNYQLGKWWGWVLIGLGVLFTLTNFNLINLEWIFDLWPLGLVALGVYVLRQPPAPPLPEAPEPPSPLPAEPEPAPDSHQSPGEFVESPAPSELDAMPSADEVMMEGEGQESPNDSESDERV